MTKTITTAKLREIAFTLGTTPGELSQVIWRYFGVNGKQHYLGVFDTLDAAGAAYAAASAELHGEFGRATDHSNTTLTALGAA